MAPADILTVGPGEAKLPAPRSLLSCGAGAGPPAVVAPSDAPLLDLFATINRAFEEERARGYTINAHQPPESTARLDAAVRAAVGAYVAAGHSDWRQLARFNPEHYVRHLVQDNANFEMILICWGRGQQSRVHNHANSHCWLNVLSGEVEELRYSTGTTPVHVEPAVAPRLPGVISATTPCPLLVPTGVSRINDSMGLHAVRCPDDACCEGEGSISLHIYAPPIRRVRLYEPEDDRVVTRAPGFNTIRGLDEEHWQHASHMSSSL
ncbi:hypothetical protein CHLNCDRAFT_142389 [Chlorella variabilis]|uniref:Cysteine dioxygenase n=1 Tax=Chlorella variabilis TaxID=554065 RepID=E1Z8F8_CHLVA|nr:hypothetical protein CHLNCDRAFT_142389 [Chlorella variabilis]EFN58340.1 hypothetical protein CHLNCDRAFT_142389 [Chlorella variabilis]|eukprot:XP_005850442.1 hypothetical protein CHLNCDRAFT_142389 [Chlorella variabilis]